MQNYDLHIHSSYSDGTCSPEEIVQKAIAMGLSAVGISDHSYTDFDESYCIKKDSIESYVREITQLKEKYKDEIKVLVGIEQDIYSLADTKAYDYVIGSVHYIRVNGEYIPVDESPEILIDCANRHFQGDMYALISLYYDTLCDVIEKTNADIIGHFDLISKFNEKSALFDTSDERYIWAYKKAADKLLVTGRVFEINTGAISRGYRTTPYPSQDVYDYLKSKGAKFILSSDSHSPDTICYGFRKFNTMI